jgi:hypothetical protein
MIIRLLALAVLSLTFDVAQSATPLAHSSSAQAKQNPRSISAIQADVHMALHEEAATRRAGNNTPQVLRLVDIYREMAAHPQRDISFTLRELGQQVRTRLVTLKDHINRHSGQAAMRATKKTTIATSLATPESRILAQQLPAPAKPVNPNQPAAAPANTTSARRPTDYGLELIALIEATISPDTWNINGGPGAIVYYEPLRAIVVSAPEDVHTEIGGALGQLRAAGQ